MSNESFIRVKYQDSLHGNASLTLQLEIDRPMSSDEMQTMEPLAKELAVLWEKVVEHQRVLRCLSPNTCSLQEET